MERVYRAVVALRPPAEIAAALETAGFAAAEVDTAPDGATHLITATR